MARLQGLSYQWLAPELKDIEKQKELLREVVEAGADAILIAVNDPIQMSSMFEDAKEKGVKIIYVDTPAYEEAVTTLSTDNYSAGIDAGEPIASQEAAALILRNYPNLLGLFGTNDPRHKLIQKAGMLC